jgi:hypothetical protein
MRICNLFLVIGVMIGMSSCKKEELKSGDMILIDVENARGGGGRTAPDITTGLFAYYPLNNNANDLSENMLHGTSVNVSYTLDRKGKNKSAAYFPGFINPGGTGTVEGSGVIIPGDKRFNLSDDFSISIWFNTYSWSTQSYTDGVVSLIGNHENYVLNLGANPYQSSQYFFGFYSNFGIYDPGNFVGDPGRIELRTWYHYVVTYSKSTKTLKYYKNGNLIFERNTVQLNMQTDSYTPTRILLGAGNLWGLFFNGALDEVRFYSRVLNPADVRALAK